MGIADFYLENEHYLIPIFLGLLTIVAFFIALKQRALNRFSGICLLGTVLGTLSSALILFIGYNSTVGVKYVVVMGMFTVIMTVVKCIEVKKKKRSAPVPPQK